MQNIKDSSFRKAMGYLRMSKEYFLDAVREGSRLASGELADRYSKKIQWIERDFKSSPRIASSKMYDLDVDMSIDDLMYHEDISKLCAMLNTVQKEAVKNIIQTLISGKETIIQIQ